MPTTGYWNTGTPLNTLLGKPLVFVDEVPPDWWSITTTTTTGGIQIDEPYEITTGWSSSGGFTWKKSGGVWTTDNAGGSSPEEASGWFEFSEIVEPEIPPAQPKNPAQPTIPEEGPRKFLL